MSNIQITDETDPNNARSESNVAIDPNDPTRVVAASKQFSDYHQYEFTLATSYSTDGGHTWHDSAPLQLLPSFTLLSDPTMAWDDTGNVFLAGLTGKNPPSPTVGGIVIYTSTDGGKTWSAPNSIHTSASDDKQWLAGDANPASPFHGNVYAVWDDTNAQDLRFARTTDHGATWIGAGTTVSGSMIASGSMYPEIDVSSDGAVYIVSITLGGEIRMLVSTDGGDSFQPTVSPATGVKSIAQPSSSTTSALPGGTFRVITDPTACAFGSTVLVAWADSREGVARIYYAQSLNGGATWTTGPSGRPLLSGALPPAMQHFHPQIVVAPDGVIGCAFYEFGPKPTTPLIDLIVAQSFDGGASFNQFTVTDEPWDPTLDAPWARGNPSVTFIGDYIGLDASENGFIPVWTDTRTQIQNLWTAIVPERRCSFVINKSTIGQDEVDARRKQSGGMSAVVPDAFRVVVDGLTAAQVGATDPGSSLQTVPTPAPGISIYGKGNYSETGGYGPEAQRFTFIFDMDFGPIDTAFGFTSATELLTLHGTAGGLAAAGELELIKQPDPFMLHGDPPWLSVDLRVFVMRPGEHKFGVTMGGDSSAAPGFIQQVAKQLSRGNGSAGGQSFDDANVLPPDEEHSSLFLHPTDGSNTKVFNFALARVRYVGLIGASEVRVFFRLFNAQTTNAVYDYPPGARYRRAPLDPGGDPIPLAGVLGTEYVTIPFFALPRVDSTAVSMTQQTDSFIDGTGAVIGNVQGIDAHADGSEVDTFFGCWLDINQPTGVVLPVSATGAVDGPFTDPQNPAIPIAQSIVRNLHQCLIAEVAFDPVPTPVGKDPANWDKLAQRNLAWSDVGSAAAVTTFEIRPTQVGLPVAQPPDELMVDWGTVPAGTPASFYLPSLRADDVIDMASRLYTVHGLTRVDEHTIGCRAGGITYVPVPPGSEDYAGVLAVEMPAGLQRGSSHTVVVRQVTNAGAGVVIEAPRRGRRRSAAASSKPRVWRRVIGAFQLVVPVQERHLLLPGAERQLALLRWIDEAIPHASRWHPVFHRYLEVMAGRVTSFGGDPTTIEPSPYGPPPHGHHGPDGHEHRRAETGKITGLLFDRFGDFDGFLLQTEHHERLFRCREQDMAELAERVWEERLRITVWAAVAHPERPLEIVVHTPPGRLSR